MSILKETLVGELSVPPDFGKMAASYMQNLKQKLEMANKLAIEHTEQEQTKYVNRYNLRVREKLFNDGDQVIVLTPDSGSKIYLRWVGPVTIKEHVHNDQNSYIVIMLDGSKLKFHANKLRMFHVRVDPVGVIFDNDNGFGQIHCVQSNNTVTETETKFDLKHLNDNQRIQMLTLLKKTWEDL